LGWPDEGAGDACNLQGAGDVCTLRVLVMPSYRSILKKYYVLSTLIIILVLLLFFKGPK